MTLTKATYSMIDGAPISTLDFGVVGNGTTDDTAAFNAARAAARSAKRPLIIYGTPKITSQLTVNQKEHWIFDGFIGNTSGSRPSSYLIKAAAVAGPLVTFSSAATNSIVQYGGIVGEAGNTGDGYLIQTNSVVLEYPYVETVGQDGIRVGSDTPGSGVNANSVFLFKPVAQNNGRHGIYLSDGDATLPSNANALTLIAPFAQNNGADGIRVGNSAWSTILNPLCETNGGYGIYLTNEANISIFGGDSEQNVTGEIFVADPQKNKIYDLDAGGFRYSFLLEYAPISSAVTGADLVVNGDFSSSNVAWVLSAGASIAAGAVTIPAANSAIQKITTVKGATYTIRADITTASTQGILRAGSNGPGTFDLLNAGYITTSGVKEYTFTAVSENTWVQLLNDTSGTPNWVITSVEIVGNITSDGTISPRQAPTTSAPAYVKGAMYFDTTLNKLRIGGATGWETVTSV
jgi:hypothetical protein